MRNLLKYFRKYRLESILAPLFKMLEAIFELLVPLAVADIIDNGIKGADTKRIWLMAGLMLALGIVGLISAISAQFFAAKAAVGVCASLRSDLFEKIQSMSHAQSEKIGSSTLITRLTSDVTAVQTGVNLFLRLFMRSPFIVFGAMIMAFTINTKLALIFALTIPALALIVFGIMLSSIPLYKKVQSRLDSVLSKTRSNYGGTRVIRAFNRQQKEINEFDSAHSLLTKIQLFSGKISALMNPLTYVIINLAVIVLIKRGALSVDSGIITQGQLIALYNYMSQILIELIKLANLIITLNKCMASVHRINTVFDTESVIIEPAKKEISDNELAVEFDGVSFGYSQSGDLAIENISFSVKKGQTVGIIGGTGSGKSTLVNLLPGFYYATDGNVFIKGKNTACWDRTELMRLFGVVPQKPELFFGTIRSNLCFGNNASSDEELNDALRLAQAYDFVSKKEDSLDHEVLSGGSNFSGGQKQRLTIARALVRKPEFLILDDSSSALDYATETSLRKAISSLVWKPTTFIVSQRASSVISADLILVLDDGKLVGIGKHSELLESCSVYKDIYDAQFGGEEK